MLARVWFTFLILVLILSRLSLAAAPPIITSLDPASVTAGGPTFMLTVNGSGFVYGNGFVSGSQVQFGGITLSTGYIGASQLTAIVPANAISTPGNILVEVINPGSVVSNLISFTINPPGPVITGLSPTSIAANFPFPSLDLTVNGSGFGNGAIVQWNGAPLTTAFVSQSQLKATVPRNLLAAPGTATVVVVSGGLISNSANFTIGPPNPEIDSLNPASVTAGSANFTLTVTGRDFAPGVVVQFAQTRLATTFVDSTQLTAFVPANLVAAPGTPLVAAINPGGGISDLYTFTINPPAGTPLTIVTSSPLPAGTAGIPYSVALEASGGVSPYKAWTVVAGSLPPGLALSVLNSVLSGLLDGVPTTPGTYNFTVQVTDGAGATATRQYSLTISGATPSVSANGILNAASYAGGTVAPGEIVTIFGSELGPETLVSLQVDSRGYASTALAGTQVYFNGVAAPIVYTQARQVSVVVPYSVSGKSSAQVQIAYQGQSSNVVSIPVTAVVPGIFTLDRSGHGPGAILNQDGTVNSTSNPAPAGSVVFIYATGEGQTNPPGVDGKPDDSPAPVPVAGPATATVGGVNADVLYAGGTPGLVAGVLQLNVRIPATVPPGGAVPGVFTVGGKPSQDGVTLAVGPPAN